MKRYDVAAGDTTYGLNFLAQLEKGNASISPFNMRAALALLYEGATRETAKEIADVAGFSEDRPSQREAYNSLLEVINHAQGCTLRSANGLWLAEGYPVKDEFRNALITDYLAQARSADFKNDAEKCREEINNWVSKCTEEKIQELFPGNSLNKATVLVLASALYFKGMWENKFQEEHTRRQDFTLANGKTVKVDMMRKGYVEGKAAEFKYTGFDGTQALALPYKGKEIVKAVFLPPEGESVDNLVAEFLRNQTRIGELVASMYPVEFSRVELPKHELRGDYNLIPLLESMGIARMFSEDDAQFDGISTANQLYVGCGFHKTFFKSDEEGSEGAAATGFGVMRSLGVSRPKPVKEFVADRPFLEAIVHTRSGSVLFLNRIENPNEK